MSFYVLFGEIHCRLSHRSVSDTLDDLLQLTDKPVKSKKKKEQKSKPVAPPPVSLFDDSEDQSAVGDMGTDDILKYIQQNQTEDDDLELFWFECLFGIVFHFVFKWCPV